MKSELRSGARVVGERGDRRVANGVALSEQGAFCPPTVLFLLWSSLFFSGALFPDFLRETVLFALQGLWPGIQCILSVFPWLV